MPSCPACRREYADGTSICTECNELLISDDPVYCDRCAEEVESSGSYCTHCGALLKREEDLKCGNHPSSPAIAVCIVCSKPICVECARKRDGKFFCEDDKHIRIYEGWAVLLVTGFDYEAQMVKANLERAEIECLVFSQQDHALFFTIGDLAKVKVMVPKSKFLQAQKLLEELDLLDQSDEEED